MSIVDSPMCRWRTPVLRCRFNNLHTRALSPTIASRPPCLPHPLPASRLPASAQYPPKSFAKFSLVHLTWPSTKTALKPPL
jgi:hypothetical protein